MAHLNNKQNKTTNQISSRQDYNLIQPCPRQEKQQQQKVSTNFTLYEASTNYWTKLRRAETERKKKFHLEAWEKETSNTISLKNNNNEKAEKYYTNEGTN